MNYGEFHQRLQNAERDAYREGGYVFEDREVRVVDEEGFVHDVAGMTYDKESGTFWIRSTFRRDKENV